MRKQQKIWEEEHKGSQTMPSLGQDEPSSSVVEFTNFLKSKKINSGKIVDIGCGKGRNAIYLAKLGFEVYGIDYIQLALDLTKQLAIENGIIDKVHLYNASLDKKWPFKDDFFDVAIDCFSSIDIETKEGRKIYRDEMFRTLKPGGFAMITVVSINDEIENEMKVELEKNSVIWPNGKFQKDYDEEELRSFYQDFDIIELKEIKKRAFKLGRNYTATNFYLILRKP